MISYTCPHCNIRLEAPESLSGKDQDCPSCKQRTIVPVEVTRVAKAVTAEMPPPIPPAVKKIKISPPGIITTPILISAICNCFAALCWLVIFFPCAAVPIVLLVMEFKLYSKLNNPNELVEKSEIKNIAIFECVNGLFCMPSLIAGIIILTNMNNVDINNNSL